MKKLIFVFMIVLFLLGGCIYKKSSYTKESPSFYILNKLAQPIYLEFTGEGISNTIKANISRNSYMTFDIADWNDEKGSYIYSINIYSDDTKENLLYSYNKNEADAAEKIEDDFLLDDGKLNLQITEYLINK